MKLKNIKNLNFIWLGALNGFIFGGLIQAVYCLEHIYINYLKYLNSIKPPSSDVNTDFVSIDVIYPTWHWDVMFLAIATLILGAIIGYFAQKSFIKNIKSKILQWQLFGVAFFVSFWISGGIYNFAKDLMECPNFCNGVSLLRNLLPSEHGISIIGIALWFLLIAIFNLLFVLIFIRRNSSLK